MRYYRINDQNPIKTKRLLLTPLNEKELAAEEAKEDDELLRGGLAEMRRNMIESFDRRLEHRLAYFVKSRWDVCRADRFSRRSDE
jgi:hypothetical protein